MVYYVQMGAEDDFRRSRNSISLRHWSRDITQTNWNHTTGLNHPRYKNCWCASPSLHLRYCHQKKI